MVSKTTNSFMADFETTTDKADTRVWAWGVARICEDPESTFEYGNDIDGFFDWCKPTTKEPNKLVLFHNLKFDGEFIIYHLLAKLGFTYSDQKRDNTFNCIISKDGQFYEIEVIFQKKNKKYRKVTFRDSHKKLPFKVDVIGKSFKLPYKKIKVDKEFYSLPRPIGHKLTSVEVDYLKHDVLVVASALHIQFEQGLTKMTIGSDAMSYFKSLVDKPIFDYNFPSLPLRIDDDLRGAYKGGWTYLNGGGGEVETGAGLVYDKNSMYPAVMVFRKLPFGYPLAFEGEYKKDLVYDLFIQAVECVFELKEGKLPTIQIKGSRFADNEYLLDSGKDENGDLIPVTLLLTNPDLELFFEHYDVTVWEWRGGYKFKSATGIFKDYVEHWMEIKEVSVGAIRNIAKLLLNNLYGKFGTNPDMTGRYPVLDEETGAIKYKMKAPETGDPMYLPMAIFITSWARYEVITSAQSVYPRFIYADTDSIHLRGLEAPEIDIHPTRLGAWKKESEFTRARFVRQKTYIEEIDGELHVTCAGMPDEVKEKVTWDNFHSGQSWEKGKLAPRHVAGGIVLEDTPYTIKRKIG